MLCERRQLWGWQAQCQRKCPAAGLSAVGRPNAAPVHVLDVHLCQRQGPAETEYGGGARVRVCTCVRVYVPV